MPVNPGTWVCVKFDKTIFFPKGKRLSMVPGVTGVSPHLCAAVLASSTPALCIHVLTAFIPAPSGSCLRVLPPRCALSGTPNMKKPSKTKDLPAPSLSSSSTTGRARVFALRYPLADEHRRRWRESARAHTSARTHTPTRAHTEQEMRWTERTARAELKNLSRNNSKKNKENRQRRIANKTGTKSMSLTSSFLPAKILTWTVRRNYRGWIIYSLTECATLNGIILQVFSSFAFLIWMDLYPSKGKQIM